MNPFFKKQILNVYNVWIILTHFLQEENYIKFYPPEHLWLWVTNFQYA